ncbi:TPA: hypothetical protein U0X22_004973 [Klebsiella pneumoniae]|nr:hypothetical protein [Klebsiella pneumoniae]HEM0955939.1 hypothetical protein [Klebsiella pneumoniae]
MTVYITIQDVDELLGDTWAAADKKGKAVLQANTWMTALNLQDIDPEHIPEEVKEGANKQVISSQADSLIKISRIWADFFPANTSNQPI